MFDIVTHNILNSLCEKSALFSHVMDEKRVLYSFSTNTGGQRKRFDHNLKTFSFSKLMQLEGTLLGGSSFARHSNIFEVRI